MEIDPGAVLQEARAAYAVNDYVLFLDKYLWFYENALKYEKSYYGVRLSYCLSELADLGKVYPTAREELTRLKETSLKVFNDNRSYRSFHEYSRICDELGVPEEPVEIFLKVGAKEEELAKQLFASVYEELAKQEKWEICRNYMGNGYKQYKEIVALFDACVRGANRKEGSQGEGIIRSSIERTVEELLWILKMQFHFNAKAEVKSAIDRIAHDFVNRGFPEVYEQVSANAPNKANSADAPKARAAD